MFLKILILLNSVFLLQNASNAVTFAVAEQYISAFGNIAKEGNTLLLPSNTGDVSSMVAQVKFSVQL